MKDENFLKENNARHMWHPMTHPADSLANPPEIIVEGEGRANAQPLHHDATGAIGEAPILVAECFEGFPGFSNVT